MGVSRVITVVLLWVLTTAFLFTELMYPKPGGTRLRNQTKPAMEEASLEENRNVNKSDESEDLIFSSSVGEETSATAEVKPVPSEGARLPPLAICHRDAPANVNYRSKPRFPIQHPATAVFFLNRFYSYGACLSVATALHYGFKVHLIGLGYPGADLKRPSRMHDFAEELRTLPKDELLLVLDCGDTMVVRGPDELYHRYVQLVNAQRERDAKEAPSGDRRQRQLQQYVIVSGEYYLQNLTQGEPESFSRRPTEEAQYRFSPFPNTGIFVGFPEDVANLFQRVFDVQTITKLTGLPLNSIDQFVFTALWGPLKLNETTLIDTGSNIALSLYVHTPVHSWLNPGIFLSRRTPKCSFSKSKKSTRFRYCNLPMDIFYPERNYFTNATPVVMHWNGPSKYKMRMYLRCYHRNYDNSDWLYQDDVDRMNLTFSAVKPTGTESKASSIGKDKQARQQRMFGHVCGKRQRNLMCLQKPKQCM